MLNFVVSISFRYEHESKMQGHLQLAMSKVKAVCILLENRTRALQKYVIGIINFSKLQKKGESWYSPSTYAFPGGYKLCLKVLAEGSGDGEEPHISA